MTSTGASGLEDKSQHLLWELRQRRCKNVHLRGRVRARVCKSMNVKIQAICVSEQIHQQSAFCFTQSHDCNLNSLSLSVLTCRMGVITTAPHSLLGGLNQLIPIKG